MLLRVSKWIVENKAGRLQLRIIQYFLIPHNTSYDIWTRNLDIHQMPKANIEYAINKSSISKDSNYEEILYEGSGATQN